MPNGRPPSEACSTNQASLGQRQKRSWVTWKATVAGEKTISRGFVGDGRNTLLAGTKFDLMLLLRAIVDCFRLAAGGVSRARSSWTRAFASEAVNTRSWVGKALPYSHQTHPLQYIAGTFPLYPLYFTRATLTSYQTHTPAPALHCVLR